MVIIGWPSFGGGCSFDFELWVVLWDSLLWDSQGGSSLDFGLGLAMEQSLSRAVKLCAG